MKLRFTFFAVLLCQIAAAQITFSPEEEKIGVNKTAGVNTSGNKPFWLGTGNYPLIHLDSSQNHKVGIGVGYKSGPGITSPYTFSEHAKLHIRHEGGPGSSSQSQKGPHLLLDEATANGAASIRFRQSTLETSGPAGGETLVPGSRYWDLRGFANGALIWDDEFRLINSAVSNDLLRVGGNGKFTFSGDGITTLEIKSKADNLTSVISFGSVDSLNTGNIRHFNTEGVTQFETKGKVALALDNGFAKIGSDPLAPKVKTWLGTGEIADASGNLINFTGLPVDATKILDISVMLSRSITIEGIGTFEQTYKLYNVSILNNIVTVGPAGNDEIGEQVRVFVVYME
ncbi:hypothetical protein [Jiulongibacter sediminis]|uniref:Uncharacterized protein n=1 Tax=Jiulongibacter sediminis TaxID=1605367 RepID=A0A0P7BFY8_9BACT|nr:hypothetical protein [Jiulongibacter sediminis]KPM49801.1 hypothetical protein AFM12_04300 [Jiulongibacter sediminis]TBX26838.1 hypothetical protein TK44_04305 [Jiulongibacter sediminis]